MPDSQPAAHSSPATSLEVRERLVDALNLDLIGPSAGDDLESERLPGWVRPSNWYLTGFLIPAGAPLEQGGDADEDDDLDEMPGSAGLAEESTEDRKAAKKGFFPSSMGLSFLVPDDSETVTVTVKWADYEPVPSVDADGNAVSVWQRWQNMRTVPVSVVRADHYPVANSDGLWLHAEVRTIDTAAITGIPQGTRSISVFLVNGREPDKDNPDLAYAFQAGIEVEGESAFVPRPDPRGAQAEDWDDQVADLHYADTPEHAVGHGVSADWEIVDGACRRLRTTWIPSASVEKTETSEVPGVELSMDALGAMVDGAAAETVLRPLVDAYRAWIEERRGTIGALQGGRRDTAEGLLHRAHHAADRIEQGISVLVSDGEALDAFRVANRAVASALRHRLGDQFDARNPPRWRAFQLAFILLNLPGLADPSNPHRETVDLLFFPTGGGKTEAYLGLAAFTMVLRRLRSPGQHGVQGAGVSIIMRYTLRLLTLDQLARASGLVCALELEREADAARYGEWPFEIGLWVGKAATPNLMGHKGERRNDSARAKTRRFRMNPRGNPSPVPLESCPWCGTRFEPDSFALLPDADRPTELRIVCASFECDFSGDRPLPILAVDEPIYRRLPAFLIATADKFASLPWVAETGKLLGGAERFDRAGFHGPSERGGGQRLDRPLAPPDLVIQDELHLISGPLGTMAGLYETAIEALCIRKIDGRDARPKIVASTATVRQAQKQIQALFGRSMTQIFPPAGARSARFLLRSRRAGGGDRRAPVPRHHVAGPQPEGAHAKGLACTHGRGGAGLPRCGGTPERGQSGRPLHDGARLLQQPPGARRSAPDSRRRGAEHRQAVREPEADRRAARALSGSKDVLGGGGADLAGLDEPGRRRPPASGTSVPRSPARGLRDRDQHDLGGPRHSPARTHGGPESAEDPRGVHSGDESGGARRPVAGSRGDAPERAQAAGPLALRTIPPLPRDVLSLGERWRASRRSPPGPSIADSPAPSWDWPDMRRRR